MSALKDRITADMKTAMREKDKERLATIRMLTAAIKQREVDERIELTDDDVVAIVEKLVKQRREAEAQYRAGDRPELADQEAAEAALLTPYLPAQLDEAEIDALIEQAMADTGAESMRDMGKVMGQLKPKVAGFIGQRVLLRVMVGRVAFRCVVGIPVSGRRVLGVRLGHAVSGSAWCLLQKTADGRWCFGAG